MQYNDIPNFLPALPEIFMSVICMALLIFGVFKGDKSTYLISWLVILSLVFTSILCIFGPNDKIIFSNIFIVDDFSIFSKVLILIGAIAALAMSLNYIRNEGIEKFEYPILIMLSTLGMMMMVSANDLISLYVGLELQSLALYVLAAFKRDTLKSSEAGLKYFVLGALSSGMLLYGASLIYGFSGTTNFETIQAMFTSNNEPSLGIIVGIVFIISAMAFKVSAVPFHMWTPDVYEGSTTSVTAFLSMAPKIAAMALFIRLVYVPFYGLVPEWQQVIVLISAATMIIGALAAIRQTNIKRLMAYSSIGHMGFALLGLSAGTQQGVESVLIYMFIYLFMNIGVFVVILSMRVNGVMLENIYDLSGLGKNNPFLAIIFAVLMFSLAGIPPLAGFFGKFYVFLAAVDSGLYILCIIGVVSSVVGAFYYLRIVKIMYFDEPVDNFEKPSSASMISLLSISGIFTTFFIVAPTPLISWAQHAASSIIQ